MAKEPTKTAADARRRKLASHVSARARLGIACVIGIDGTLAGVVTDGDVRRAVLAHAEPHGLTAAAIMTAGAVTVAPHTLAAEALHLLEARKITAVVVVDEHHRPQGIVHLHDLWKTGLV